jgi:hypothetical protein
MIGCTDYPAFYKMMVRAAKKYNKELMAEAKASARAGGAGGKGGTGGDIGMASMSEQEPADSKGGSGGGTAIRREGGGDNAGSKREHETDLSFDAKSDFK